MLKTRRIDLQAAPGRSGANSLDVRSEISSLSPAGDMLEQRLNALGFSPLDPFAFETLEFSLPPLALFFRLRQASLTDNCAGRYEPGHDLVELLVQQHS